MKAMTNGKVRILSSTPLTHREDTLRSISLKAHALTERIEHIQHEGQRLREVIQAAPGAGQSRIDWIHQQLQKT